MVLSEIEEIFFKIIAIQPLLSETTLRVYENLFLNTQKTTKTTIAFMSEKAKKSNPSKTMSSDVDERGSRGLVGR